jgi:hypothetical protein
MSNTPATSPAEYGEVIKIHRQDRMVRLPNETLEGFIERRKAALHTEFAEFAKEVHSHVTVHVYPVNK